MHLNRRNLNCHPNLRHRIFVFDAMPNVLLFHNRGLRTISQGGVNSWHPELVVIKLSA